MADILKLREARAEIEKADRAMAEAFEKRMAAVRVIAAYKAGAGTDIEDREREAAVIENGCGAIKNESLRPYFERLLKEEIAISKDFQKELILGKGE